MHLRSLEMGMDTTLCEAWPPSRNIMHSPTPLCHSARWSIILLEGPQEAGNCKETWPEHACSDRAACRPWYLLRLCEIIQVACATAAC